MKTDLRLNWLIAIALTGWLFYVLAPVLTPFVAAALLAYLGDPLAALQREIVTRDGVVGIVERVRFPAGDVDMSEELGVLGSAGARRGAHAVLVDDERRLSFRVETRGAGSRVEAGPSRITVTGEMTVRMSLADVPELFTRHVGFVEWNFHLCLVFRER